MTIARSVAQDIKGSSWIRRMFEAGRALKRQKGADHVFDFSLGNPSLEPPRAFAEALRDLTAAPPPGMHRYMPNAGFPETRNAVARHVAKQEQADVEWEDVVLTCGAAGALHIALHALLDPGDEVLVLAPYFVEYLFYVRIHQGNPRLVQSTADFDLDVAAIDAAINPRTKVVLINTPNNPTGRIYSQERMAELGRCLQEHERRHSHAIYLLADTPYAKLTFDDHENPLLFADHPNTLLAHSHSKDLGLAGERIGYLVVSPQAEDRAQLRAAMTFCNRVLGFINAPALMQRALERAVDAKVDVAHYQRLRDVLCDGLRDAGYEFVAPQGAFYLFPRTPVPDDLAFVELLRQQDVLVVPGRGFGRPGHVRIAFCVDRPTIERALPRFADARARALAG